MVKQILSNRLFQNIGVYTVSNIINAAIPFLLLPILTRYLSTENYGIIATFQSLVGLFSFIIGLNTQTAMIRRFYDVDKVNFSEYVTTCLFILLGSTTVLVLLLIPFSSFISRASDFPRNWLWMVIIVSFFQYLFAVILGIWQARTRVYYYAFFQNAQTLLNLALSLLLIVYLGMNWQGRIIAQAISMTVFGLAALLLLSKMKLLKTKINKKYFADALKFGLPLIPYSFTGWILLSMDRIFINNMLGLDQTGLYSVAYQVCMIITLIQISFNTAWVPWLYTKIKKDDPLLNIKIVKFSYGFVLFNFLLAAMLALAGPAFFKLFLGKNFYQATNFIWWLSLAQAANAIHIVAVTYLNYHNKNIYLTYSAIFTALIHIPIIYWLIKANGTIGAAQALFISNLITSFMTFFFAFKFHKMPWLFWLKSRTER